MKPTLKRKRFLFCLYFPHFLYEWKANKKAKQKSQLNNHLEWYTSNNRTILFGTHFLKVKLFGFALKFLLMNWPQKVSHKPTTVLLHCIGNVCVLYDVYCGLYSILDMCIMYPFTFFVLLSFCGFFVLTLGLFLLVSAWSISFLPDVKVMIMIVAC